MSDEHHPFGGSALDRRFGCTSSYWMELGMPDTTSSDAERGTKLHEAIYNDETYETLDDADRYAVDIIRDVIGPRESIIFEEKLQLLGKLANKRIPISFGSCDIQIRRDDNSARIADAKFGAGPVPIDTWQTKSYAAASIQKYNWDYVDHGIIQPMRRIGPWHTMARDEADDIAKQVQSKIIEAKKATIDPRYRSFGVGVHCKYCKANMFCPALRDAEGAVDIEKIEDAVYNNSATMWDLAEAARGKASAIIRRVQAVSHAMNAAPDGFYIKEINGNRKISDPVETTRLLVEMDVPIEEILEGATFKIGKIESLAVKAIADKLGCTKAEAKAVFEQEFPIDRGKSRQELTREL